MKEEKVGMRREQSGKRILLSKVGSKLFEGGRRVSFIEKCEL